MDGKNNNNSNNSKDQSFEVDVNDSEFEIISNDDEGFIPLSQQTKSNDTDDGNGGDAGDDNDNDNDKKSKGSKSKNSSQQEQGKGKGKEGKENEDSNSVITLSDDEKRKLDSELDDLSESDLNKRVEEISEKSIDSLTEEEKYTLEKAGYDVAQLLSDDNDDDSGDSNIYLDVATSLGFEIDDSNPENVEFIKGLKSGDKDSMIKFTEKMGEAIAQSTLEQVFQKSPSLGRFYQHIVEGGDEKTFVEALTTSLTGVRDEFEDDLEDTSPVVSYMKEALVQRGIKPQYADTIIRNAEEAGNLIDEANALIKEDNEKNQSQLEKVEEQRKAEAIENRKKANEYWNNVKQTLDTGKLRNFTVPNSEKNAFFEWLASPVDKKSNLSQSMLDKQEMSLEDQLALEYLRYKKFDLSNLISNAARSMTVKEKLKVSKKESKDSSRNKNNRTDAGIRILSELDDNFI